MLSIYQIDIKTNEKKLLFDIEFDKIRKQSIENLYRNNLLHKLFYFNIIKTYDDNFVEYFQKFMKIFCSKKYHCCWYPQNYILNSKDFSFMKSYYDYYVDKTFNENKQFVQQINNILQNKNFKFDCNKQKNIYKNAF